MEYRLFISYSDGSRLIEERFTRESDEEAKWHARRTFNQIRADADRERRGVVTTANLHGSNGSLWESS